MFFAEGNDKGLKGTTMTSYIHGFKLQCCLLIRMSMIEDEVIPRKNSDMRYIENDCNEQRKDSLATLLSGLYAFDDSTGKLYYAHTQIHSHGYTNLNSFCPSEVLFTEAQREFYQKKFSDVLVAYADLEIERKSIGEG